jgi:hypothetical protein
MSRPTDPFELGPDDAGLEAVERELEAFADETRLAPSAGLTDRIMAAVAAEPVPTPPVAFLHAVGALALVDAWRAWRLNLRVALGAGRATGRLRMQALAVVVVAALLVGLGGTTVAVGAARLVQAIVTPSVVDTDPTPTPEVSPSPEAVPTPSPEVSPSPDPSKSPDASEEPGESGEPDESNEPEESDDSSGSSSGSGSSGKTATPRPDRTPEPDETEDPDETDDPDETETPDPDDTPKPTSTSSRPLSVLAI